MRQYAVIDTEVCKLAFLSMLGFDICYHYAARGTYLLFYIDSNNIVEKLSAS